jgi:hypothetical protein
MLEMVRPLVPEPYLLFLYLLLDESLGNLEARNEKISVKIADFGNGTPFGLGRCFPFLYLVCSYVG